jgi:hypothetical protein
VSEPDLLLASSLFSPCGMILLEGARAAVGWELRVGRLQRCIWHPFGFGAPVQSSVVVAVLFGDLHSRNITPTR